ncbi:MAG: hypothetical protein AB7V55_03205 [Oscillospiraceae bacterium]
MSLFLDRRADALNSYCSVPVCAPGVQPADADAFVLMAIPDRFEHEAVAEELFAQGYRTVIYNKGLIGTRDNDVNNRLYDTITEGRTIAGAPVEADNRPSEEGCLQWEDHAHLASEAETVVANVPVDLLYVVDEANIESCIPLCTALYLTDLFEGFSARGKVDFSRYIDYSIQVQGLRAAKVPAGEAGRVLASRQHIYQQLSLAFDIDREYFERFPVVVQWAEPGYFHVRDGIHRAAFLYTRGVRYVPCRMGKAAYESWLNRPALNALLAHMRERDIRAIPAPVAHPFFYMVPSRLENTTQTRCEAVLRFLRAMDISMAGRRVCVMGTGLWGLAQQQLRMGAQVQLCEPDAAWQPFAQLANVLMRCEAVAMDPDTATPQADIVVGRQLPFGGACSTGLAIDVHATAEGAETMLRQHGYALAVRFGQSVEDGRVFEMYAYFGQKDDRLMERLANEGFAYMER